MLDLYLLFKAMISGLILGFIISIPLGPAGIESVKHTISKGFKNGLTVSLGALTADLTYLLLINMGLANLLSTTKTTESLFWIISGVVLTIISYYGLNHEGKISGNVIKNKRLDSFPFLSGFLITFFNPLTPSMWLMLSGTVIRGWYYVSNLSYYTFLLFIWIGMISWFVLLNYLALKGFNLLNKKNSKRTTLFFQYIVIVIGIGFVLFGIIKLLY